MLTTPTFSDIGMRIPERTDIEIANLRMLGQQPEQFALVDVTVGNLLMIRDCRIVWAVAPIDDDDEDHGFFMVQLPKSVRRYSEKDSRPGVSLDWKLILQIERAILREWYRQQFN